MAGRLDGKVAVVTGAASGIGRATVDLFVAEGARVIAADIQDDKGARIEEDHKGMAHYVRCNVTEEKDIAAAVTAARQHFGRLDILFNNAGTGGANDPADGVTAEGFDSVMHLHVRAALFGIKYAVPLMRAAGGGSIISTASVAALRTGYGPILYSIAKAAIVHMTHAAAAQLGPENIRVNCICPGLIATNIFAQAFGLPSHAGGQPDRGDRRIDQAVAAHPARRPRPRHRRGRALPRRRRRRLRQRPCPGGRWRPHPGRRRPGSVRAHCASAGRRPGTARRRAGGQAGLDFPRQRIGTVAVVAHRAAQAIEFDERP
ncbi:MAG: SDR family NAD(P)-dependent oxidoreductase [Rhizomicrobium sp.]